MPDNTDGRRGPQWFRRTGRCRSGRHEIRSADDVVHENGIRLCRACRMESNRNRQRAHRARKKKQEES